MTETIDRVRLQFNTEVLTKSLRYALPTAWPWSVS